MSGITAKDFKEAAEALGNVLVPSDQLPTRRPRPPIVHELKCWPSFYNAIATGRKTFEIRKNDRNYQEGDHLDLQEWSPYTKAYSGRSIRAEITYILQEGTVAKTALQPGYCAMGIKVIPAK